jgi:hypothetical protein
MVVQLGMFDLHLDEIAQGNFWIKAEAIPESPKELAILRHHADPEKVVPAVVSGICAGLVDLTDLDHTHAIVEEGEYLLRSSTTGPFKLLSTPTETGEQLMAVLFVYREHALARTNGTIAARSGTTVTSGEVTIMSLDGTTLTATSEMVDAFNMTGAQVASNTYIQIKRIDGIWLIDTEDCS